MLSSTCTAAVRGLSTSAQLSKINNVTVIGAGLMGSGIAQVSANAKLNVTVVDSNQSALDKLFHFLLLRITNFSLISNRKAKKNYVWQKMLEDFYYYG